jgi:phosphopantothenoylcysteine decarboxylase/phosphopantothenate--cysteine ligase
MSNPLQNILGTDGAELAGRTIVLGVTGSNSAYRAPDIARAMMRHGAEVFAFMSDNAREIIHPNLLEWATGNPVVTKLTGRIEHVTLTVGESRADAVVIAPCTANTIAKIAHGIDDTPVTSVVSSALGERIPIIIAPAMHETMIDQPFVIENLRKLAEAGVIFVDSIREEGRAKIANTEQILAAVITGIPRRDFVGKRVLITVGPTVENLDPVRVITNPSTGKMGSAVAFEARSRGASVTIVHGPVSVPLPRGSKIIPVRTTEEMYEATIKEIKSSLYDVVVATAAAADYKPVAVTRKIDSRTTPSLTLELHVTSKIIDDIKKYSQKTFLVAFRAQSGVPEDAMISDAYDRLKRTNADLIAVNDVGRADIGFGSDFNEIILVDSKCGHVTFPRASKRIIAKQLLTEVSKRMDS